jgi:hypothetical protein
MRAMKASAACGAVLISLVLAASAAAATKPYSLVISPGSVSAGTVTLTAKYTNENSTQQLGSSNLTPPSGFTLVSASAPAGSSGSATIAGNVLQLRGLAIAPGQSTSVTMSVKTPSATCTASTYTWNVETKQSNDFSGPPGNDLTLDSANSSLTTAVNSACTLQFGTQPHDALVGQHITGSDYNPSGAPVTVKVVDGSGNVVSSYSGPISVSLNTPTNPLTNPTPATLGGTTTRNASSGVASFNDLSVNAPGNGYTLKASGPNASTSTSSSFSIHQQGTVCPSNSTCTTDQKSADQGTPGAIDGRIISPGGTYLGVQQPAAILSESLDFGTWPQATRSAQCPDETPGSHFVYGSFTTSTGAPVTRGFEVDVSTQASLTANIAALTPGQMICFASAHPFTAQSGNSLVPAAATTLPDGTPGYVGEAPTCNNATGLNNPFFPTVDPKTGPCVSDREGNPTAIGNLVGGTLTIKMTSPFDFWGN